MSSYRRSERSFKNNYRTAWSLSLRLGSDYARREATERTGEQNASDLA